MDGNQKNSQMVEWLKKHFEVSSSTREKVPVEVVRHVFNEKFPGETNNTFGKVVRESFPGVARGRDGGGYIYRSLKSRVITVESQGDNNHQMRPSMADNSSQTLEANLDSNEELKAKVKDLETKSFSLENNSKSLKREIEQLNDKNRKLKEALAKRRRTEAEQASRVARPLTQINKSTMASVNIIDPEDLETDLDGSGVIGEGSYGKCSLRHFKRTRTLVAVKIMKHKEPDLVIREARAMQSVISQKFPFVYGVQLTKPPYGIVMEFIGNHETKLSSTLYQVVASKETVFQDMKKEIDRKNWLQICLDVAEGLCHLHAVEILHNDLKNNNVMVHEKRGYIIDLGKACEASSPPAGRKYSHQYHHIAPEVLNGGCFSKESDVFSLGQILNFVRNFCHIFELRPLEKDCVNKNYVMRPTSRIVSDKLRSIHQSL